MHTQKKDTLVGAKISFKDRKNALASAINEATHLVF